MTSRQLERDHSTAAAGIDVGLLLGDGSQQEVNVIGENLNDSVFVERAVELAAREAARVIRNNGVVGGQLADDASKASGVRRTTRHHEQHRTRPANLVIKVGARYLQSPGLRRRP